MIQSFTSIAWSFVRFRLDEEEPITCEDCMSLTIFIGLVIPITIIIDIVTLGPRYGIEYIRRI